jgi:hypothetical protein
MDEPLPLVTSSMERLTSLMEKANPILQVALAVEPPESSLPIASQPGQEENSGSTQTG